MDRRLLKGFNMGPFMHDLTNGMRIELQKFRRGKGKGDFNHFQFVGSIYRNDGDDFKFACVTDEGEEKDGSFELSKGEVATTMRLTHAITYFSSGTQAPQSSISST